MDDAIFAKVRKIICEQLSIDESAILPESRFVEDLNADSLDLVEMVMEAEEEFSVAIPDEDAQKMSSVGDLLNFLQTQRA